MLNRIRRSGDDGFGLMEVVVAMTIFGVMVTAALALILRNLDVTRGNSQRVAAANLATKQIEAARSQLAVDVPDGAVVRNETVGNTVYRIEQNANYVTSGASTSLCADSAGDLAYKLVTATVTWANMGSIAPVRADTVLALGVGSEGLGETKGTMAVGVVGATNQPMAGVTVTLSPGGESHLTGIDGCAVFSNLTAAAAGTDYTASVNQAGLVSEKNARISTVKAGVKPGQIQRGAQLKYDSIRSVAITANLPGYTTPSGLLVGVRSQFNDPGGQLATCTASSTDGCVTGLPGTVKNLFPAVYDVWAGSCVLSASTSANVDLSTSDQSLNVPLQGVVTTVKKADGTLLTGYTVTATGPCAGATTLALGNTASGSSRAALPAGTWTIKVVGPGGTSTKSVTIAPGDPSVNVDFLATK